MQTYISILRGINVSGQKMIKMDAPTDMAGQNYQTAFWRVS